MNNTELLSRFPSMSEIPTRYWLGGPCPAAAPAEVEINNCSPYRIITIDSCCSSMDWSDLSEHYQRLEWWKLNEWHAYIYQDTINFKNRSWVRGFLPIHEKQNSCLGPRGHWGPPWNTGIVKWPAVWLPGVMTDWQWPGNPVSVCNGVTLFWSISATTPVTCHWADPCLRSLNTEKEASRMLHIIVQSNLVTTGTMGMCDNCPSFR